MSSINLPAIGTVVCERSVVKDDYWGDVLSRIVFTAGDSPTGLEEYSHLSVLFHMNQVKPEKIIYDARHPRNDTNLPKMGILAQRGKNRPNTLGLSCAEIVKVTGDSVYLRGLDAVDATPVLAVNPVLADLMPVDTDVVEPSWLAPLMQEYYTVTAVEGTMNDRLSALVWNNVGPPRETFRSLGSVCVVSKGNHSGWRNVEATLQLDSEVLQEASLKGLENYSHVIFICYNPRIQSNQILAQPSNNLNGIGILYGKLVSIDGSRVTVEALTNMDEGTHEILDVKPYIKEFSGFVD